MARGIKLLLMILCFGVSFLMAWVAKRAGKSALRDRISCRCHAAVLRIAGVRLAVHGAPDASRPLLMVTNHLSYLDIPVLGSVFPFRFTPKQEIASWPGIAALCRVTDAIFVDRRPEKLSPSAEAVQNALAKGEVVCLFPEATTGNGVRTLPFRSGFFALAETGIGGQELVVQPAAIAYTHIRRLPVDSSQWPDIAWYGDMELLPHLWKLLGLGRIDASLIFLPPARIKDYGDRKRLAAHCEQAIGAAIEESRGKSLAA